MKFEEAPHGEYTHEMRAYGLQLYCSGGQEVLLDALRRCEKDDDSDVPLRAPRLRRKGVAGNELAAASGGSTDSGSLNWSLPPSVSHPTHRKIAMNGARIHLPCVE